MVCFGRGKEGAHQVINRTESPVRVLLLSTMISPEIIEYLDSDKILLKDAKDDDIFQGRLGPQLDWDAEDGMSRRASYRFQGTVGRPGNKAADLRVERLGF